MSEAIWMEIQSLCKMSASECDQFVTDWHYQKFATLKAWKKHKWLDFMDCFMIYCKGHLKVNTIWLPWLLIQMNFHEMFIVMDWRDRNFGVDLPLLFCWATTWIPFILSSTDVTHINWLPYQTSGISNQALVFVTDVKICGSQTDIWAKSAIFDNTPAVKWFSPRIFIPLELFKEPNLSNRDTKHECRSVPTEVFVSVTDGQNANP